MKVFKFGGASVKDAAAVKNVAGILGMFPGEKIIVVISAMGKTTNALERLVDALFYKKENPANVLDEIKTYHFDIIGQLFPDGSHPLYDEIHNCFVELEWALEGEPEQSYDCEYDQVVSMGEIIATKIVSAYLREAGVKNKWWDVRDFIKTDNTYREGKVDWELTEQMIVSQLVPHLDAKENNIVVTQGFLGVTSENFTTTLGREGSDYTAAILAWCTNAESVTIWKDVPGVLNADPKWFDDTRLIAQLSYQDAIELAYYGATVIHPKTIKPLQNKKITLYVRSFLKPGEPGTMIRDEQAPLPIPCFIFKIGQVLISISPKDFSFIVEENLRDIFDLFYRHGVRINTMQNSAISFSVCVDNNERKLPGLIETLQKNYRVLYNEHLELVTIRYYDQATIDRVTTGKKTLLEVRSRYTVQMVMKNK
ncbi:MAG: aspartate kinase [Bacteroidetes bacterium]|nr:MAG: aspartate kinase [Bacteroidota bacterium]